MSSKAVPVHPSAKAQPKAASPARRTKPAAQKQRAKPDYPEFPKDNDALVRLPQILAVLPIGRTSFLEGVKAGRYPKPHKIGTASLWNAGEIRALLAKIANGAA